jgi:lipopolysaccharide export system protein LptA
MRFILLAFVVVWLPTLAQAASTDKQQPAYVIADSTILNYKTHKGIYHGHVKMTQGTTIILADEITTYLTKNNQLIKAIAIGQLASYTTMPDNSKLPFNAIGQTINYYPLQGFVELIGQAKTTQGQDSLAGPHITYDINKQVVVSLPQQNGHTTIIIQPDQKSSQ